jgi:hydrogenase 3 maturation protease
LPLTWKDSLLQKLSQSKADEFGPFPRTCLVGIGNDLRGDDSAGLSVARTLLSDQRLQSEPNFLVIEGGPSPENYTGKLRAFQPELVLFIDAAQMDESPGAIQWIPLESIDGMSASSHSLPLSMLAHYLTLELKCSVAVLGIQPGQNEIGAELSSPVREAVGEIVDLVSDLLA